MNRPPAVVLVAMIDAADQVDDFVTGVLGLAAGRLGGESSRRTSRYHGRFRNLTTLFGLRGEHVAAGLAGAYGPEQLRKAAIEADRLAALLDEARSVTGSAPLTEIVGLLDELDVASMAGELACVGPRSPELGELRRRLGVARNAMQTARARVVLDGARSRTQHGGEAGAG